MHGPPPPALHRPHGHTPTPHRRHTSHTHTHCPYLHPSIPHSKESKLLKTIKFPPSFATPLDLSAVNWEALRPWVTARVTSILGGVEDDVLIEYLMEQLQGKEVRERGKRGARDEREVGCALERFAWREISPPWTSRREVTHRERVSASEGLRGAARAGGAGPNEALDDGRGTVSWR